VAAHSALVDPGGSANAHRHFSNAWTCRLSMSRTLRGMSPQQMRGLSRILTSTTSCTSTGLRAWKQSPFGKQRCYVLAFIRHEHERGLRGKRFLMLIRAHKRSSLQETVSRLSFVSMQGHSSVAIIVSPANAHFVGNPGPRVESRSSGIRNAARCFIAAALWRQSAPDRDQRRPTKRHAYGLSPDNVVQALTNGHSIQPAGKRRPGHDHAVGHNPIPTVTQINVCSEIFRSARWDGCLHLPTHVGVSRFYRDVTQACC